MPRTSPLNQTLGADVRALRKSRGATLAEMAEGLDRSVGWLSQVERDKSEPSIDDLREIASYLDVPISLLFRHTNDQPDEAGYIVRKGARRKIGTTTTGLVEELLSPDLTDDFEVVHCTISPLAQLEEPIIRPTQEVAYLVSGRLDIEIDGRKYSLQPGDSFRTRGETFRWSNPFETPAVAIWVIAPPIY